MEFEYKRNNIVYVILWGYCFLAMSLFITIMVFRKLIFDWEEISLLQMLKPV